MALELKMNIEESANAVSFKAYDAGTNWGEETNILSSEVNAAYLMIDSSIYGTSFYDMYGDTGTNWDNFLLSGGLTIVIGDVFPELAGFPDDYYTFRLVINTDGSSLFDGEAIVEANVLHDVYKTIGFLAYIREAARKLPLPLDYANFDFEENRKIYQINILMEGAEADAAVGNEIRFKNKMDFIADELNLRGITYGN